MDPKLIYFKFTSYDFKNMSAYEDNELKRLISRKSLKSKMIFFSNTWDIIIQKWITENKSTSNLSNYVVKILYPRYPDYFMTQHGSVIKIGHTKYTDRLNCFLANKAALSECAGDLDIFPETHIVTAQSYEKFNNLISARKWILKLEDGYSAKDVHIINSIDDFRLILDPVHLNKRWVLQEYICNPMLLFGKYKFHLRSHLIILNQKVHIFNSCNILAATNIYNTTDFSDIKSHITNVSVNKSSANHTTYISDEFPDIHRLMPEVYDLIEKSLVLPNMDYKQLQYNGWVLYALLAHDILVDETGKLFLLEINNSPGMYRLDQMTIVYEKNTKKFINGMFNIFIHGSDESFITLDMKLPIDYVNYTSRTVWI